MSPISKTKTPIAFLTLTKSNPDRLSPKTKPDRNFNPNQLKPRSPISPHQTVITLVFWQFWVFPFKTDKECSY